MNDEPVLSETQMLTLRYVKDHDPGSAWTIDHEVADQCCQMGLLEAFAGLYPTRGEPPSSYALTRAGWQVVFGYGSGSAP